MKPSTPDQLVLLGASTGGPKLIEQIVLALPRLNTTSVIIAQHMALPFMPSFAKRLEMSLGTPVSMSDNGVILEAGKIYICHGKTEVCKKGATMIFTQTPSNENEYNPNIDCLFTSLAHVDYPIQIISVILTGIGADGVAGCLALHKKGARCITQSKESAIVDGMPSRVREMVPGVEIKEFDGILHAITGFCK